MTRTLLVLRHGKADPYPPEGSRRGDFDRELKDRGKRDAQKVGVYLQERNFVPDAVISSPAARAKTTAQKACKTAGLDEDIIQFNERIYEARWETVLSALRSAPAEAQCLLVVGHNPGLEMLVDAVAANTLPGSDLGSLMPTAALAILEYGGDWAGLAPNTARLLKIQLPRDLPSDFPYPAPGTEERERRIRPAYYYQQSAVVPYREGKKGLEVLVISSSSGKHWGVPKGIHDPGKTAQASAAKEALEEGGVQGEVGDKALGRYAYEKWEATCTCTVYPMRVTTELSDSAWEESKRERRWMPVKDAAKRVKNADMGSLIAALPKHLERA